MLSRTPGGEATKTAVRSRGLRCMKPASDGVEGLRILIHHKDQGANVVIKAAMMACRLISEACHLPKGLPELDFLKNCFLCNEELSPCKDVYMYRGEQGFCSKECRSRQILLDERREFDMAPHRRRSSTKIRGSDRNRRRTPALA